MEWMWNFKVLKAENKEIECEGICTISSTEKSKSSVARMFHVCLLDDNLFLLLYNRKATRNMQLGHYLMPIIKV